MANSLSILIERPIPIAFRETSFRAFVESMRNYLRNHTQTAHTTIPPELAYKHRGNLRGLLLKLGISVSDHYIVMRVNDISSPHDVDESLTSLYIPQGTLMGQIREIYLQSRSKSKK